jgi:hypothetical protein
MAESPWTGAIRSGFRDNDIEAEILSQLTAEDLMI